MPFNMLVSTCLLGNISHEENDVKVCFEDKLCDEKVLFFKIDDNHTDDCKLKPGFRNYCYPDKTQVCPKKGKKGNASKINTLKPVESEESNKICDLLIYYSKGDTKNDIICFVELKGDREELFHALDQLKSAYSKFASKATEHMKKYEKNVTWIGCICCYDGKQSEAPNFYQKAALEEYEKSKKPRFDYLDILFNSCNIEFYLRNVFSRIEKNS